MSGATIGLRGFACCLCVVIYVLQATRTFAEDKQPRKDLAGDPLPQGAVARLGSERWRHDSKIAFVAFADGGKLVLTSCADGVVHIWDSQTGKERGKFGEPLKLDPTAPVRPRFAGPRGMRGLPVAAVSADGTTLATASGDQTIHVWGVAAGKEVRSFEHGQGGLTGLAITADGKQVLSLGADATIKTWDVAKGEVIREYTDTKNGPQAFVVDAVSVVSPDGALAVTSSSGRLDATNPGNGPGPREMRVVDLKTGKEIQNLKSGNANTRYGITMPAPAFCPDGTRIAWLWPEGTIHVYDTASWKEIQKLGEPSKEQFIQEVPYAQLLFAPDGKSLAALASDETICLFDLATGKQLRQIGEASVKMEDNLPAARARRLRNRIGTLPDPLLAWSPDGNTIAQGRDNLLRLWNAEKGTGNDLPAGHTQGISGIAVAADGKTALTLGKDSTVRQWNLVTAKETRKYDLPVRSRDAILLGRSLVAAVADDGSVRVTDLIQDKTIANLTGSRLIITVGAARSRLTLGELPLSICGSGNTLVQCNTDMLIRIYDIESGKVRGTINDLMGTNTFRPSGWLLAMACSRDGRNLVIRNDHQERYLEGPGDPKSLLRSYDLRTGRVLWEVDLQSAGCEVLAFSPDDRTLAYVSAAGDAVTLFETATGRERFRFQASVASAAFSDDGQFLAVGGTEGSVTVVDLRSGKPIAALQGGRAAVRSLAFSPDAGTLLSGAADGTALVWNLQDSVRKARRLTEVDAETAGHLWEDLGDADGTKAYRALTTLICSPQQAVTLLKARLKPAAGVDDARIDKLILDLDSDEFDVRSGALLELGRMGERARAALEDVRDAAPSDDVRKQVQKLLGWLEPGSPMPDLLRESRAVEILETLATSEARSVLESLSKGARGRKLTREAAAALKHSPQAR